MGKTFSLITCILISIVPLVYLAIIWDTLPAIVPTHFNSAGKANGFSERSMLWVVCGGLACLSMGMYFLMNNLHRIDPKRKGTLPSQSFTNLGKGLVLFLTVLNFAGLLASSGHELIMTKFMIPVIGLLFVFLGNVMYSIKPNYFAGIRTPWTLTDDDNWRATHRVAGVAMFIGGVVIVAGSLLLEGRHTKLLVLGTVVPMILIPTVYSFWFYRRANSHNQ